MMFNKEFVYQGKHRLISGEVRAELAYATKMHHGTHAFTHDDYVKEVPLHRVVVMVDGHVAYCRDEMTSEEEVYNTAAEWITQLMQERLKAADTPVEVPVRERLTQLFR